MQYKEEYDLVETKNEFMSLLLSNYNIWWTTSERRWYDLNKVYPKKIIVEENKQEKIIVEENKKEENKKEENKKEENKQEKIIVEENKQEENKKEKIIVEEYKQEQKVLINENNYKYPIDEVTKPSHLKMLELEDMKKLGYKITRQFLYNYHFSYNEVNWLDENNYLN